MGALKLFVVSCYSCVVAVVVRGGTRGMRVPLEHGNEARGVGSTCWC